MIELSYVSLFSGIEAFSVAASRIEGVRWNPVFFSEIDPFPCAVLAHHFPTVPNLGDICKIRVDREKGLVSNDNGTTVTLPRHGIDILAGGSPCQDLSVAGLRKGAERGSGTRSALFFEYARLVEELRPRILLFENVPGMLSSNQGRDFLYMQSALVDCGYSLAWRILDAQYTVVDGFPRAVPQRRKRVWLVGCLGADESVPAQILFERPGVLGDTPPRREAGQGFAAPLGYCVERDDCVVGGAGGDGFDLQAFGKYGDGGGASTLKSRDWKDATDLAVQMTPMSPEASAPQTAGGRTDRTSGSSCACDVNCLSISAKQQSLATADNTAPTIASNDYKEPPAVLCTNSNGEDVMPTLTADEYKMTQAQKDKGGGVLHCP